MWCILVGLPADQAPSVMVIAPVRDAKIPARKIEDEETTIPESAAARVNGMVAPSMIPNAICLFNEAKIGHCQ